MFETIQQWFYHLQFNRKQQQAFLEDLSSLVEDGVPVNQAIEMMHDISRESMHQVSGDILTEIAAGGLLADGMEDWFVRPVVEVVRAGEESGTLSKSLKAAVHSFGTQTGALLTLVNAMLYPLVVVCMALGLTVFMKSSVLNSFVQIKPLAEWPSVGQQLYGIATITQHWWWLVLLVLVGLGVLITRMLKIATGKFRAFIDKAPFLSMYRDATAARFMETMGLLITNGVVFKKALAIMHRGAAPYLSWHLLLMEYRLSGGRDNIADVLDTNLIRENDLIRLRLVAKGKGFEHALISLGKRAHDRNAVAITIIGRVLGGLLLALGAGLAVLMVFGVYTVGSTIAL